MDNPLSEEQVKKINEISQLPAEQQQAELNEFLKTLTSEQVEFLKKQQGGQKERQCPFCLMAEGKIPVAKIYEDNFYLGVLDINPATKGHVILFPKLHRATLSEIKDVGDVFNIANSISNALMKVGAEGTNIYVANGAVAGQTGPHVLIHIIPRYTADGVSFRWNATKFSEEEMKDVAENIKKNLVVKDEGMGAAKEQMEKIIYKEQERRG